MVMIPFTGFDIGLNISSMLAANCDGRFESRIVSKPPARSNFLYSGCMELNIILGYNFGDEMFQQGYGKLAQVHSLLTSAVHK